MDKLSALQLNDSAKGQNWDSTFLQVSRYIKKVVNARPGFLSLLQLGVSLLFKSGECLIIEKVKHTMDWM